MSCTPGEAQRPSAQIHSPQQLSLQPQPILLSVLRADRCASWSGGRSGVQANRLHFLLRGQVLSQQQDRWRRQPRPMPFQSALPCCEAWPRTFSPRSSGHPVWSRARTQELPFFSSGQQFPLSASCRWGFSAVPVRVWSHQGPSTELSPCLAFSCRLGSCCLFSSALDLLMPRPLGGSVTCVPIGMRVTIRRCHSGERGVSRLSEHRRREPEGAEGEGQSA